MNKPIKAYACKRLTWDEHMYGICLLICTLRFRSGSLTWACAARLIPCVLVKSPNTQELSTPFAATPSAPPLTLRPLTLQDPINSYSKPSWLRGYNDRSLIFMRQDYQRPKHAEGSATYVLIRGKERIILWHRRSSRTSRKRVPTASRPQRVVPNAGD